MTNEGLGVGLALGLGIPLTVLTIIFAVTYGRRKHPKLPAPNPNDSSSTEHWLKLYHATRPRISHPPKPLVSIVADKRLAGSFTKKICSMMEGVGLVRKPVVQEVYVMENGTKVSK
ncbi:hypothetical protein PENFLA_c040G06697 [Penicillium flavigenum]|uniref:Uncharacterized protein n=1 Tax=Penicillium flavigenum TaxID=254877 RepID=A0A1V6SKC6_9EURO|nr:hypothetical protein PENFLA_c040G06697 [Penicillium flavigenum]